MIIFYSENYLFQMINDLTKLYKKLQKNIKLSRYESSAILYTHFIIILKCYRLKLVLKNTNISLV